MHFCIAVKRGVPSALTVTKAGMMVAHVTTMTRLRAKVPMTAEDAQQKL